MKDRAGETLKKALKVNFRNRNQRVKEFIGSSDDTIDVVRFKARSSAIAITTKGLGRKEDLTLYQVDRKLGKTLKKIGKREFDALRPKQQRKFLSDLDLSKTSQGKKKTTFSTDLEKGVYFLVVSSKAKKRGKYTLQFSASPLETVSETDSGSAEGGMDGGVTDGGTSGGINDGMGGTSGGGTDSGSGGGTDSGSGGGTDSGSGGGTDSGSGGGTDSGSGNTNNSWMQQLGSSDNDYGYSIAVDDAGNVYVAGTTAGDLSGATGGSQDNFVTKYDAAGTVIWTRQFDFDPAQPGNTDTVFDIEVDSAGNYYVVGATGNIPESFSFTNISDYDADGVVAKYNSNGDQLWKEIIEIGSDIKSYDLGFPLGTVDVHQFDAASSLAIAPDGSVYVAGFVEAIPNVTSSLVPLDGNPSNGFIAKFDGSTGTRAWLETVGGADSDAIADITIDNAGNIYVTGVQDATITPVDIGSGGFSSALDEPFVGGDAFVAKYQDNGSDATVLWSQTIASTDDQQDYGRGIALDTSGNVYITGDTAGSLPGQTTAGNSDGFVAKYDTNGVSQWTQQFGSAASEQSQAIAIDSTGKIYITGETAGNLYGSNVGADDIWIATYNTDGNLTDSQQFGTANAEELYRATVDSSDNVYFVGQTFGDLTSAGANQGLFDVITLKNPMA